MAAAFSRIDGYRSLLNGIHGMAVEAEGEQKEEKMTIRCEYFSARLAGACTGYAKVAEEYGGFCLPVQQSTRTGYLKMYMHALSFITTFVPVGTHYVLLL